MTDKKENGAFGWIEDMGQEVAQSESALSDYRFIKVYNPMMGTAPDPVLDGSIIENLDGGEKGIIGNKLQNVQVLAITKCYEGFGIRYDDNNSPVKNDNGKVVQDLYFTPEVSVYDKGLITIARKVDGSIQVLGRGNYAEYTAFTTCHTTPDGKPNPMFGEIKTNQQTQEKYPTSIFKLNHYMYFRMDGELFKIKLGGSYGHWKDPQEGSFLHAKNIGADVFKKSGIKVRHEPHYSTFSASVKGYEKFNGLVWEHVKPTEENLSELIRVTQTKITKFNEENFVGVDLNNTLALPYVYNKLMLDTSTKVGEVLDAVEVIEPKTQEQEISVEDVPF